MQRSGAQAVQRSWDFAARPAPTELPRWTAPYASMIFSDESSQKEQFFVLGGLCFWVEASKRKAEVAALESRLADVKAKYGLSKTVKWEKVPHPGQYLEGYKALIREVAATKKPRLYFKCMIVDRHKYPLDDKILCDGEEELGYIKMYCTFLTSGIMLRQEGYFYDITVDRHQFHPHVLRRTVEFRYLKRCKTPKSREHRHCDLVACDEENSNLLQVVDLLIGAVAFCRNGGMTRDSKTSIGRKQLVEVIRRSYNGVRLDGIEHPKGRFVIWNFMVPRQSATMTPKGC